MRLQSVAATFAAASLPHYCHRNAGEQERVLPASIDLANVEAWRRDFPALRDAHWQG